MKFTQMTPPAKKSTHEKPAQTGETPATKKMRVSDEPWNILPIQLDMEEPGEQNSNSARETSSVTGLASTSMFAGYTADNGDKMDLHDADGEESTPTSAALPVMPIQPTPVECTEPQDEMLCSSPTDSECSQWSLEISTDEQERINEEVDSLEDALAQIPGAER